MIPYMMCKKYTIGINNAMFCHYYSDGVEYCE